MYCSHCGKMISDGSKFCAFCGTKTGQSSGKTDSVIRPAVRTTVDYADEAVSKFSKKVNELAGGEGNVDLHIKDMFSSEILKKHSREEADEIFICGTAKTTPEPGQISAGWPRPWLYTRVALFLLVPLVMLQIAWVLFKNIHMLPGIIFLGSFFVPVTVLFLFFEMDAPRNIGFIDVLMIFFLGGCASLLLTLILYAVAPSSAQTRIHAAVITGIIEEAGKFGITAFYVHRNAKCKYILNGLLAGGAIGAGFAAFESAGYAFAVLLATRDYNSMLANIYQRALLAPGGHVAWAGITGAALMIALAHKPFTTEVLTDKKLVSFFLIAVAMHATWNMPFAILGSTMLKDSILIVIAWIILLVLFNRGFQEINDLQQARQSDQALN